MLNHISANGVQMAYRFDGPEGAPVLMLSNSLMSTHRMWDPQMTAFTQNFRVLRYDTRGHGASETTPGPYTIDLLARDAEGLIDRPDLVRALCLCDTASEMPTLQMWNDRIGVAEREGLEGLIPGTIERWFTPAFRQSCPAAVGFVEGMIRDTSAPGYIACASAVRDMSQTGILKDIKAPSLVLVGADDPACTPAQAQVLRDNIADAQYIELKEAAHLANIEQPAAFNTAILEFLNAI